MGYQVMPDLTAEEYAELKADIAARGVMVPVEYDEGGNVLDGHHRLRACIELGITDFPRVVRPGMSETEKRLHARKLNMARRHLTREQRQGLIRQQLLETPERSDRQIAAGLGVNHETVGTQRKNLESTGEIRQLDRIIGADGKERPRNPRQDTYVSAPFDEYPRTDGGQKQGTSKPKPPILQNTGNNERYTPKEYIEAARKAMGSIDLDPASSELANQTVEAAAFYTEEQDGLAQEWFGNIWLNPPYATGLIGRFAEKLAESSFDQAIILVHNATETRWFARLIGRASAIVFPTGRIDCKTPGDNPNTPLQGSAFIYCGDNPQRFLDVFLPFGWGARLHDPQQGEAEPVR